MRVSSQRERQSLLAMAFEYGIRHFDVARLYGLGAAEAELGRFARGRRDEMTIATKFGIEPTASAARLAALQGPARAVMARFPALRAAVKRRGDALNEPRRYDAATARRSLDRSLAELGTDYFDLLFVHDPSPGDAVLVEELLEFFGEARKEGKIRGWGVASEDAGGAELVGKFGPDAVLQERYDVFVGDRGVPPRRGQIVFGLIASALPRLTARLAEDERLRSDWSARLGSSSIAADRLGELLLGTGLEANDHAVVLISTSQPARIARAAEMVNEPMDPARLSAFRDLAVSAIPQAAR